MPGISLTKIDLRERIKEIEARIKLLDVREKAFTDLKKWMAARKLEPADVSWMMRQMRPKRAAKAVTSKKPLKPKGYGKRGGTYEVKGDPLFQRAIREARKDQQMTTNVLAQKMGVSGSIVSCWERGKYVPREDYRSKLVKLLGLPANLGAKATAEMEKSVKLNGGRPA